MKKVICIFLLIGCLAMVSSCGKVDEGLGLKLCGSYAVTGMFYGDLKGEVSRVSVLETDAYGRILFAYSAPNLFLGEEMTAYVICQKIDDSEVCYYEDICYYIGNRDELLLQQLKQQNDWGCPINEMLFSKRDNSITFDMFISLGRELADSQLYELAGKCLQIPKEQMKQTKLLDISPSKQELHLLQTSNEGATKQYLLLLCPEGQLFWMELAAGLPDAKEIAGFKKNNSWVYG